MKKMQSDKQRNEVIRHNNNASNLYSDPKTFVITQKKLFWMFKLQKC